MIDRDAAREAAREELSRREYAEAEPPLLLTLAGRAVRAVEDLFARASGAVTDSTLALVGVVALLALLVTVVLLRLGPLAGARERGRGAVFDGGAVLTADGHRARAEQAASEGRWAEAVRERLRALVRELEARGVLDPRPGRTAGEVARDAGGTVPHLAADLTGAARLFDEVWYGGRVADASSYASMVRADDAVRGASLAVAR